MFSGYIVVEAVIGDGGLSGKGLGNIVVEWILVLEALALRKIPMGP